MKLSLPPLLLVTLALLVPPAQAFPPTPPHTIYGQIRDEYGTPLTVADATIVFETPDNVTVRGAVIPTLAPGVNYRLPIPMDAGLTQDAYKPTAMRPNFPFKLKVQIGDTTYLPIEMAGDFSALGQSGKETRIDLTLGVDSDNDGLPDAWENYLISSLGGGLTLADINGNDDADKDGLSNLQEYLTGNFAHDPENGFTLAISGLHPQTGLPKLRFLALRGRSYSITGSADLKTWHSVDFTLPNDAANPRNNYTSSGVADLTVDVFPGEVQSGLRYFQLRVQ